MTYVKERPATTGKEMENLVQSSDPDKQQSAPVATPPLSEKPPSDEELDPEAINQHIGVGNHNNFDRLLSLDQNSG